ncbi:MAG: ankyrin repeat domain-containing protein [Legionella sp.]|jgi:ankyrin repeat protein
MTTPLINQKTYHQSLIDMIHEYGCFLPNAVENGVCQGISRLGIFAFFAKQYELFKKRIQYTHDTSFFQFQKDLERVKNKSKNQKLTAEEQMIIEMPAFYEGISAFQNPNSLMKNENVYILTNLVTNNQDNFIRNTVGQAMVPQIISEQGGLIEHDIAFQCLSTKELKEYLAYLNTLIKAAKIDIVLNLNWNSTIGGHANYFAYDAELGKWHVFDINDDSCATKTYYINDPVDFILGNEGVATFGGSIISKKSQQSEFNKILAALRIYENLNQSKVLSKEKIEFLKKLNPLFLGHSLGFFGLTPNISQIIDAKIPIDFRYLWEKAILKGKQQIIKLLLKKKIPIPLEAFSVAASSGNLPLIKQLIAAGGDINQTNKEIVHPLYIAARAGHIHVVRYLIEHCKCPVTVRNSKNKNLLQAAFISRNNKLIDYILKFKVVAINQPDDDGITPLIWSIIYADEPLLRKALAQGAEINDVALIVAVQQGKLELLKLLINSKFDINKKYKSIDNGTLLHIACSRGHVTVVKWLLDNGADINAINDSTCTPLMTAIKFSNSAATIDLLLNKTALTNRFFPTPLHIAVTEKDTDLLPWLIKKFPADLNVKNSRDFTPLTLALVNNNVKAVNILIEAGAEVTKDSINSAVCEGHLELALMLTSKLYNKEPNKSMFIELFNRCLPYMDNKQIIATYERLTCVTDPLFGFIHHQRHDFFDRLRMGIVQRKFNLSPYLWQTATFRKVAYKLADKFAENLKTKPTKKIDLENETIHKFIYGDIGNFFKDKSKQRTRMLLDAIKNSPELSMSK